MRTNYKVPDVSGDITKYLEIAYANKNWDLVDALECIRDIDSLDVLDLGNGKIAIVDIYSNEYDEEDVWNL